MPLPFPSRAEQDLIVEKIEAVEAWLSTVESEQEQAAHLLDHLDQGLLGKAFRGELVPQDPNDEPAERLLERIRTTRGAQPRTSRGRAPGARAAET
jgi:type I restriction enzyme S subunit